MVKEYVAGISQMVVAGITKKSDYHDIVAVCDKVIDEYLNSIGYVYTEPVNLFRFSTDERLEQIETKKRLAEANPESALQEVVKLQLAALDNFLKKYHIGFCQEATISEYGTVHVSMPCLITCPIATDKKVSARKTFEMQLAFLKNEGFVLKTGKHSGPYLVNCEQNMRLITELLSSRGCKGLEFRIRDDKIDKIKFVINVVDLHNMDEDTSKISLAVSEELNADEIAGIKKLCSEMGFAESSVFCLGKDMSSTCGSLIESYFSDICKIVGYSGVISQRVEARHKDSREKNQRIRDIENEIGTLVSPENIKGYLSDIQTRLNSMSAKNICFSARDFNVDRYGLVNVKFRYITNPIMYMVSNCMDEATLKDNFNMNYGNRDDETLYMVDDYENKIKIENILKKFIPSINLKSFSVDKRDGAYVITEFTAFIDNILDLFNLEKGAEEECI